MLMNISSAAVCGWPGFLMTKGNISLGLVPDLGGRIMSLCFRGQELLYAPIDSKKELPVLPEAGVPDLAAFKRSFGFRIFGGDKTWVAPEAEWLEKIPPLDLDAGRYAFEHTKDACVMTSPVCRETGLQVVRQVVFLEGGDIALIETLRNKTDHAVTRSIWNVTQIARPFDVFIPAEARAIRSYYHEDATLPDPGFIPFEKDGWAVIPCRNDMCFKFGGLIREGRTAVIKETPEGMVIFARVFDIAHDRPYAHRSMVEVFNSSRYPYGEVEVHGALTAIPSGGEVSLSQLWRVYFA
jgi:hypothetical protein